jgi:hypothetical protein
MMNMAPSVATLPIVESFAHGDVISKPSSSIHAISVALACQKNPSAGGEEGRMANAPGGAQTESGTRAGENPADQVCALNFELIFLLSGGVADSDQDLVEGPSRLRFCFHWRL